MTDLPFEGTRLVYNSVPLNEGDLPAQPMDLLRRWIDDVTDAGVADPTAMSVSTVDAEGVVTSRAVLMRQLSSSGVAFFTNYESEKAKAIKTHPQVAALFVWREFHRQVRLQGVAAPMSPMDSDRYFASRPRDSQLGAWASPQSEVVESREALEARFEAAAERYEGVDVPRPPFWGGYLIEPTRVEFWQGRPSRLHDRIVYDQQGAAWSTVRLAP